MLFILLNFVRFFLFVFFEINIFLSFMLFIEMFDINENDSVFLCVFDFLLILVNFLLSVGFDIFNGVK